MSTPHSMLSKMKNSGSGTEVGGVADAGGLQVGLAALGDRTRVAVIALAVGRFDHVAGDDQRRLVEEGVDVGGGGVGHQQHVGGLDALPAGDRGAVERMAVFELVHAEGGDRHANVLFLAARIGEAEVHELDFLVLDQLEYVLGGHELLS
jgi:hypothetical protein